MSSQGLLLDPAVLRHVPYELVVVWRGLLDHGPHCSPRELVRVVAGRGGEATARKFSMPMVSWTLRGHPSCHLRRSSRDKPFLQERLALLVLDSELAPGYLHHRHGAVLDHLPYHGVAPAFAFDGPLSVRVLALGHLVVHELHRALVLLDRLEPSLPGRLSPERVGGVESKGQVGQRAAPGTDPEVVWL